MKYSVSIKQPYHVLSQADEVRVDYKNIEMLYDYGDVLHSKSIVVIIPQNTAIDYNMIKMFADKFSITFALESLKEHIDFCKAENIPFFWNYNITNYYELDAAVRLGVDSIKVGGTLYFDIPNISLRDIKIRTVPNVCTPNYMSTFNPAIGTYIRPEDLNLYEPYIDCIEFVTDTLEKEALMLKIYKVEKAWNGNLNLLLTNFNMDIDNRAFNPTFGFIRMNCKQQCVQIPGSCTHCDNQIKFIQSLQEYKDNN